MREGFKVLGTHCPGCLGERDEDGLTFIVHDRVRWDRDKIGRLGGSTGWHYFKCNDVKCSAELAVRWDVLAKFINAGASTLDEKQKGTT